MGTIEKTVRFDAAPEKVWGVVSDPSRFGEWLGMHKSWKGEPPAQFSEGTQATAVVSLLNMPNTITWTVAAYDANSSVTLTGTGMAGVKVSITLEVSPNGGGSDMTIVAAFEGQMLVGAIGAAVEKAGRTELDESTGRLAALMA